MNDDDAVLLMLLAVLPTTDACRLTLGAPAEDPAGPGAAWAVCGLAAATTASSAKSSLPEAAGLPPRRVPRLRAASLDSIPRAFLSLAVLSLSTPSPPPPMALVDRYLRTLLEATRARSSEVKSARTCGGTSEYPSSSRCFRTCVLAAQHQRTPVGFTHHPRQLGRRCSHSLLSATPEWIWVIQQAHRLAWNGSEQNQPVPRSRPCLLCEVFDPNLKLAG